MVLMGHNRYHPRLIDSVLQRKLKSSGAVLITGPKACGKTTTGLVNSSSSIMLQGEADDTIYVARNNPLQILEGPVPRLIDEWQMAPNLWDAVRNEVDRRYDMGQFILTGSSVPQDDGFRHSGVGRIAELRMHTMSLFESNDSSGVVSLKRLFDGTQIVPSVSSEHNLRGIVDLVVRGGWPRTIDADMEYVPDIVENYYNATIGIDVFRVDGRKKDVEVVDRLMRSYSRNISTMVDNKTIVSDVTMAEQKVSMPTVLDYMDALRRLYIIEDVTAWSPAIRSKKSIRQSSKRHFTDPSLAVAALNLSQNRLLSDLNTFGFLLESLCVRDLRIYSQPLGGTVHHYHDSNDLEADLIVQLRDGRWGCIEVKAGASRIKEGVENLLSLKRTVEESEYPDPSFMMVIVSNGYVSLTPEGVWVVPIDCLGP